MMREGYVEFLGISSPRMGSLLLLLLWKLPDPSRQNQVADPSSLTGFQLWKSPVTPGAVGGFAVLQLPSTPLGLELASVADQKVFFHLHICRCVQPCEPTNLALPGLVFQILQYHFSWGGHISGMFPTWCPLLAMGCWRAFTQLLWALGSWAEGIWGFFIHLGDCEHPAGCCSCYLLRSKLWDIPITSCILSGMWSSSS